ncbi:MAG: segregation/condensation protein A [Acidimicrobiales bacterium]|jgi:segregation and condensation protein A|nr:segregation/condensation protein A [Acidimicrobiales bacterium]HMS90340.1 ScpA family protein [Acidimicrobiales bacterium]
MTYEVHTTVFEGPFDLLLHLILNEQVELYDVSLCRIVDVYLAELEKLEGLDLEVATEFLLIAATLVELKTRRLLPGDADVEVDDEFSLWEERDLLLARLVECKTFKDAALLLSALADEAGRSFPRTAGLDERYTDLAPDLLAGVTAEDLRAAFARALTPKPVPRVELDHVAPSRLSVTEAVAELVDELPRLGPITFRSLTDSFVERLDVVVRFLAVLELYKQGMIDLDQPTTFGDLTISWIGGEADDDDRSVFADLMGRIDVYEG